jgi:hypothetical protein
MPVYRSRPRISPLAQDWASVSFFAIKNQPEQTLSSPIVLPAALWLPATTFCREAASGTQDPSPILSAGLYAHRPSHPTVSDVFSLLGRLGLCRDHGEGRGREMA